MKELGVEEKARLVQVSGRARVAADVVDDKLRQIEQVRLHELLQAYRAGQGAEKLVGPVASLAAIDDLRNLLVADIKRAVKLEQNKEA